MNNVIERIKNRINELERDVYVVERDELVIANVSFIIKNTLEIIDEESAKEPQVQPIVRTPEEIAEMFDDMTSPHYCEKCPNETICETTWGVGCKQHWIDWLTGKEVE